jgi:hypothetical protein
MKFSFPSVAQWRSGVIAALTRFPWNILCGATGAGCAIISIHTEHNDWLVGQCERLAMAAALGMPLFFSLRMLRERIHSFTRWPIEICGIPFLALWFFAQPARPFDGPGIVMIRWLLLLAALHFLAALSAYARGGERLGFWQFNRRLFLRFCLATLYTGVLTVGLELALLSANKLFELKLSKAYGDLWFVMVGLFHPAFFLAGVPRDFAALDTDKEYPRGLKAFTQFALAPLVAVYTAILYAYAVKIIVAWSWPHGWTALPVLLVSGIGILAFLLLYPLREREEEKWARWFTTNFPRALAPLTLLLLLSLRVRISEYGVTESRYLGAVLGFWILIWALVFVIRKQAGIRWVPSSLALICFLTAFGPWSAGAISQMSQLHRLERMLEAHGLWKDGHAARANKIVDFSSKDATNVETTINYLVRTHGGASIRKIFEPVLTVPDWSKLNAWDATQEIEKSLQLKTYAGPLYVPSQENFRLETVKRKGASIDVAGFREAWRGEVYPASSVRCGNITISLKDGALLFSTAQEQKPQNIRLEQVLNQSSASEERNDLSTESLTVDLPQDQPTFRLIFDRITFRCDVSETRITGADFYLLQK